MPQQTQARRYDEEQEGHQFGLDFEADVGEIMGHLLDRAYPMQDNDFNPAAMGIFTTLAYNQATFLARAKRTNMNKSLRLLVKIHRRTCNALDKDDDVALGNILALVRDYFELSKKTIGSNTSSPKRASSPRERSPPREGSPKHVHSTTDPEREVVGMALPALQAVVAISGRGQEVYDIIATNWPAIVAYMLRTSSKHIAMNMFHTMMRRLITALIEGDDSTHNEITSNIIDML